MNVEEYITLLSSLIREESFSGQEDKTADIIQHFLSQKGIPIERIHNNVVARNRFFNDNLPLVALNSHHDTVKIGNGWTKDPFGATITNGQLFGRGSNDAGGALVSLIATFCHYFDKEIPYNLMLIASGEEENFGKYGVSEVLNGLTKQPDFGIIGEPTEMKIAIAEKGLIVVDATTYGESGHAARNIGENALYLAMEDINWIKNYNWEKRSGVLGETKTTVTQVSSGTQHNVIPDKCTYVIDCRVNEHYTLTEVMTILKNGTHASLVPRSLKWHPSGINKTHPFIKKAISYGRSLFGSPTLSDQVHFKCPTIKMGPGKSERSHTPDEFILLSEIESGIKIYIDLLDNLRL